MFEILFVLLLLLWIALSAWTAFRAAKFVRNTALKVLLLVLLAPFLSALPFADEIAGMIQFDRLCKEVEQIKILGTRSVGEDLYFPDGRWRLSSVPPLPLDEFKRTQSIYDSLVKHERVDLEILGIGMPIHGFETRLFDRESGKPLASYRIYGTRGGWISRRFEKPALVRDQCLPESFDKLNQLILPYRQAAGKK